MKAEKKQIKYYCYLIIKLNNHEFESWERKEREKGFVLNKNNLYSLLDFREFFNIMLHHVDSILRIVLL